MPVPKEAREWEGDDPPTPAEKQHLNRVFSEAYEELRRLAYVVRQSYANATLNPTALVDEAYVKLAGTPGVAATSKLHFKRIAARAMRQILIEAARRRGAQKRGGGDAIVVTLDEAAEQVAADDQSLLAVDAALEVLKRMNPRQAAMVEYRFFAGMDIAEVAALLEISEATVLRDWRAARAWLAHQVRRSA